MKFTLISDNHDTLVGMRLAGIDGVIAHEPGEVETALKTAIDDESVGIILITEKLVPLCPDIIYELKLSHKRPLIVEIPDRHTSAGRSAGSITKYIKDAIGVKLE